MDVDVGSVLFEETFTTETGFAERWPLMRAGDFCADDGVVVTSPAGLTVAPGARHPRTGQPCFTKAVPGPSGHLKWLAITEVAFPTGEGAIRVDFRAGARTFGMDEHPFGEEVEDPLTDLRLGAGTLNVLDFESGLIFDFWITQGAIYPIYERLRFPGLHPDHQAFTSIRHPIARRGETEHDLAIVVDAADGAARWEVDGRVVAEVAQLGPPSPDWRTVLNHGGTPAPATPARVQVGLGLMTLLDAALNRPDRGLVDLESGYVPVGTFHGGPHLWGQGAELTVRRVAVTLQRG
jgi:hypothetical protein